ncbi:small acid-soluble spore protein Tlp [Virgibacillus sp. C22-A2]|uniref:Small, acid-soluble spore protein Tlp n=1 Tax=Virgibacillus tibetensis TaxID=3042313 RepID=A0ABU6KBS1_9BACI|nr:small acid-soluble spore protein Tlp [Virgibacillus sp. C22-A2]
MTEHNRRPQPKPDDRSDNVEKLQNMVQNTIENIEEAHDTMKFSSGEEKEQIKAKNKRREEAIEGMRHEIKDEYRDQDQLK